MISSRAVMSGFVLFVATLFAAFLALPRASAADPALNASAYDAFYNLDFDQALAAYDKAVKEQPGDPELHNHVAHTLLYRELFRNGALESEMVTGNNSFLRRPKMEPPADVERRFFSEIESSMRLCEAVLAKNPKDSRTMHTLAVAYALRANYGFLVRKTWIASLGDSSKARKYDNDVTALDPKNYDALFLQGVYDYIIGSLPFSWRMLGHISGFHGDRERGLRTIELVTRMGSENKVDAAMTLCGLYRREGNYQRAIPMVQRFVEEFPRNYLLRFELAQMYAAGGRRQEALDTVAGVERRKVENAPGYGRIPWEKIHYETGNLQFWFNDLDHALDHLKQVTATPQQLAEIDLNTGVLALMRQGQIYDLKGRHDLASIEYKRAIQFAPEAEAAKESQKYLGSPYRRVAKS